MQFLQVYSQLAIRIFGRRLLLLHGGAVFTTFGLVYGGYDWAYLVFVLHAVPFGVLIAADIIGFLLPILLPLTLWVIALVRKSPTYRKLAVATSYAIVLGFTLSTILKAFTGRTSPPHFHHGIAQPLIDNSHAFNFGFMNEHVIGGWPSSHTTIAFALATTLALLLPRTMVRARNTFLGCLSHRYRCYVWFSLVFRVCCRSVFGHCDWSRRWSAL